MMQYLECHCKTYNLTVSTFIMIMYEILLETYFVILEWDM